MIDSEHISSIDSLIQAEESVLETELLSTETKQGNIETLVADIESTKLVLAECSNIKPNSKKADEILGEFFTDCAKAVVDEAKFDGFIDTVERKQIATEEEKALIVAEGEIATGAETSGQHVIETLEQFDPSAVDLGIDKLKNDSEIIGADLDERVSQIRKRHPLDLVGKIGDKMLIQKIKKLICDGSYTDAENLINPYVKEELWLDEKKEFGYRLLKLSKQFPPEMVKEKVDEETIQKDGTINERAVLEIASRYGDTLPREVGLDILGKAVRCVGSNNFRIIESLSKTIVALELTEEDADKIAENLTNGNGKNFLLMDMLIKQGADPTKFEGMTKTWEEILTKVPDIDSMFENGLNGITYCKENVETLGLDFMLNNIESGPNLSALNYLTNNGNIGECKKWIDYLHGIGVEDGDFAKTVFIFFEENEKLVSEILSAEILVEAEKKGLIEIISSVNKFGVKNMAELADLKRVKIGYLEQAFLDDDIHKGKKALETVIFGGDKNLQITVLINSLGIIKANSLYIKNGKIETKDIDKKFIIDEKRIEELIESGMLDVGLVKTIRLVVYFRNFTATDEKGQKTKLLEEAKKCIEQELNVCIGVKELDRRQKALINQNYSREMFRDNLMRNDKKLKHTSIEFNGSEIPVTILDGEPFKMLVHKLNAYGNNGNDPSTWNVLSGGRSYISSSLISSEKINIAGGIKQKKGTVIYGFTDLGKESILQVGSADIYTIGGSRGKAKAEKSLIFFENEERVINLMTPNELLTQTSYGKYNEVVLDRYSGDLETYDGRLQPSCILVFGKSEIDINDEAKQAANYFGKPIYLISRGKYGK